MTYRDDQSYAASLTSLAGQNVKLQEELEGMKRVLAYLIREQGGLVIIPRDALTGDYVLRFTRADDMESVVISTNAS